MQSMVYVESGSRLSNTATQLREGPAAGLIMNRCSFLQAMVMVNTEGINSPERAVSVGLERRGRDETHGEVAQEGFNWCWP